MSTSNTPNMLRAALWYASRNVYIFPVHEVIFDSAGKAVGCTCEPYRHSEACKNDNLKMYLAPGESCKNPGKCPRVRWSEKSTIDVAAIKKWWQVWPNANIGVDCGKTGWLVFDSDSYKQLADISDLLSIEERETVTVLTGGGGEHLIYDRQSKRYGNSTRGLPAGIDIRGVGGYVIAPPSLHKSGKRYSFEESYGLHQIPLLPIPSPLDRILSSCTAVKHSSEELPEPDESSVARSVALVKRFLEKNDIESFGEKPFNVTGRKWVLKYCPFNPEREPHAEDSSAFITVNSFGAISAGCHHNRCRTIISDYPSGWELLKVLFAPLCVPNNLPEKKEAEPAIILPAIEDIPIVLDFSPAPPTEIDKGLQKLAEEELARKMKAQREEEEKELLIARRTEMFFRHALGVK